MANFPSPLASTAAAAILLGAFSFGVYRYTEYEHAAASARQKSAQLQAIADRLARPRSAEILLAGRNTNPTGQTLQLLFIEYAPNERAPRTVREFTIPGPEVHLDASLVRMTRGLFSAIDPLRATSVPLFTRLSGHQQPPDQGLPIDTPGSIPSIYQGADPAAANSETLLWTDLWKSLDDPHFAKTRGMLTTQGPGLSWQPQEGQLHQLSIQADGSISLTTRPAAPGYLDAMKKLTQTPATMPASASADDDPDHY